MSILDKGYFCMEQPKETELERTEILKLPWLKISFIYLNKNVDEVSYLSCFIDNTVKVI